MIDLDELIKRITFITESYVFGQKFLDNEKIKKKKVKLAREHLATLLDSIRDMADALELTLDDTDYSLRVKVFEFLLESYDSLAKAVKYYHYVKRAEVYNDELSITEEGAGADSGDEPTEVYGE